MKIVKDGQIVTATPEEEALFQEGKKKFEDFLKGQGPSIEERLKSIESALRMLLIKLPGGK